MIAHIKSGLFVLLMCGLSSVCIAQTEFKIITLQHRFAQDLLPVIQPMVGEDGTASAINENLLIRASPERMTEIEQVISRLDTARKNMKVSVDYSGSLQREQAARDVNGRVVVRDGDGQKPRVSASAGIEFQNRQIEEKNNKRFFLNVLDGERAYIRVGQSVAFTQQWLLLAQRYTSLQRVTQFKNISTGFAVRPRSIGEQVELEITPSISSLEGVGVIDFEALSTVVRVTLGQWFDLGGTMQNRDEVSRAILSNREESKDEKTHLQVKIE